MSLFHGSSGPTKLNQVAINQSVLGYALPVVMGKGKVQQSLLWLDGFTAKAAPAGGKGLGGGKGSQFLYTADVIAALCNGPVNNVGSVWAGQSWLSQASSSETITVPAGGDPTYTPTNATTGYLSDIGVSVLTPYTGTFTDLGASGSSTLSGTDEVPLLLKPYLSTLTTGQYSIDPATNNYHFAASDTGKTVIVRYNFNKTIISQQENNLIPAGKIIHVGGSFTFHADNGVIYFTGPNNGKKLTKVTGTPSVTGTYAVSGSGPATYTFAPGDVNAEVQITFQIQNNSVVPKGVSHDLNFSLFEGLKSQSVWGVLATSFPGAALGYTGITYVAYNGMELGFSAEVQQNIFEVQTADLYGGGIVDCNPVWCILRVLTDTVWGLGAGPVPFPVSAIDNGAGTWGDTSHPQAQGVRRSNSTAWTWFASNNFFISPVIDKQDGAAALISKWLEAGQCSAFMSEGLLKLVPYGDTSTAANGATWVAPSAFAAAVDDSCFIPKGENEDPVKISTSPWQDAYNTVQVNWNNRANQYAPELTQEFDQAAINRYGSRIEDPQDYGFITTLAAAVFAASMRVKRNVYTRNTYEFRLPYSYSYLECMDILYITTSSVWAAGINNANLNVVNLPVRITKIVDNPGQDGLEITAEDYPFGVHQPTIYNKDLSAGQTQANLFEKPGDTQAIVFEATNRLTLQQGNEIWMGALGSDDIWGGCNVWVSQDGTTYKQIGAIETPARLGALVSTFASGSDPDTVNSLVVQLAENSQPLEAGTSTDANNGNLLCFVDGEIISYSACSITGQEQYTMGTYIRRGFMGSTIASHASSSLFLRLDDSIFKFTYDPTWAGKTIFIKFQSFNAFGNSPQDLADITAVSFTIPGLNPGTVDASTGLLLGPAGVLDNLRDGTTYARPLATALTSGAVDPTKTGVLMKGSVVPTLSSGFSYASAPTSITWKWYAHQAVYRADGTVSAIGAGTQAITGLLANNTYYFYPYYDEATQLLKFLKGTDITIPNITGVLLNGTTQFIQTATAGTHADPGASIQYSLEFWIKTTTTTNEGILSFSAPQGSGAATAQQVQVSIGGALGEINFAYANSSAVVKSLGTTGASANDGAWHHVVITFATGGTITIYVDGTSRGTASAQGAQGTAGANCWWHMGMAHGSAGWPVSTTTFLAGSISHVAIYTTALDANQVAAHCQSFINLGSVIYDTAVTNDSPSFNWKLTETSGTSAADSAGANTGTYQNAPTLNQSSAVITVLGSPAIAWPFPNFLAAQGQTAQGRVPLSNGSMSALTPSSGTGGGTGGIPTGGGSRGGCFSGNTRVMTNRGTIPIAEIRVGDYVLTARGTLRQVLEVFRHEVTDADRYAPLEPGCSPIVQRRGPSGAWLMHDMGEGELVTLNHALLSEGVWHRAYAIFKGKPVVEYALPVFNISVEHNPDEDHLARDTESSFALANGWMAHNLQVPNK